MLKVIILTFLIAIIIAFIVIVIQKNNSSDDTQNDITQSSVEQRDIRSSEDATSEINQRLADDFSVTLEKGTYIIKGTIYIGSGRKLHLKHGAILSRPYSDNLYYNEMPLVRLSGDSPILSGDGIVKSDYPSPYGVVCIGVDLTDGMQYYCNQALGTPLGIKADEINFGGLKPKGYTPVTYEDTNNAKVKNISIVGACTYWEGETQLKDNNYYASNSSYTNKYTCPIGNNKHKSNKFTQGVSLDYTPFYLKNYPFRTYGICVLSGQNGTKIDGWSNEINKVCKDKIKGTASQYGSAKRGDSGLAVYYNRVSDVSISRCSVGIYLGINANQNSFSNITFTNIIDRPIWLYGAMENYFSGIFFTSGINAKYMITLTESSNRIGEGTMNNVFISVGEPAGRYSTDSLKIWHEQALYDASNLTHKHKNLFIGSFHAGGKSIGNQFSYFIHGGNKLVR